MARTAAASSTSSRPPRTRRPAALVAPIVLSIVAAAFPAPASHGVACGGTAPAVFRCVRPFTAEAPIVALEVVAVDGVVGIAELADTAGERWRVVCAADTCVFSVGEDPFPAGTALVLSGHAAGAGPWAVRALYAG